MTQMIEKVTFRGIRVLIADDDAAVRDALADLIEFDGSFVLVGAARDAEEAIKLAEAERPDVALLDVKMPRGGGPRAARGIRVCSPSTRSIGLSAYGDRSAVVEMLRAGAVGYLVKGTSGQEIRQAIRETVDGRAPLDAEVASRVIDELAEKFEGEEHEAQERRRQTQVIRRVLRGEGLTMSFQPIFDLGDRRVVGVEGLARFSIEPSRPPDVWFREADDLGLGLELELAAAGVALDHIAQVPDDVFVSVNASPRTVADSDFLELVAKLPASRVVLEVTEHAPVADYEQLNRALGRLRELGVRLAIDDAGAGYASLRHILQLSPEFIKLDVVLTQGIDTDPTRRALAHALIAFSSQTGAAVIAEGIETQEALETLRTLGVGYGQGYYLARPGKLSAAFPHLDGCANHPSRCREGAGR